MRIEGKTNYTVSKNPVGVKPDTDKNIALANLRKQRETASSQLKVALEKVKTYTRRLSSTPGHRSATVFGSETAELIHTRGHLKYHLTKWTFAAKAITSRHSRLSKLINRKIRS